MRAIGTYTASAVAMGAWLVAGAAHAHPVTVDGSAAEWLSRAPSGPNLGIVARGAAGQGELVWTDAVGDARTDLSTPENEADLAAFAVTADATNLYFRVEAAAAPSSVTQPPQVQIAIDLDRVSASGATFFGGFADTVVVDAARWEFLVQTQVTGGALSVRVLDTSFSVAGTGTIAGSGSTLEIAIPWSVLGLSAPAPVARFTVATFRENPATGNTVDIGGSSVSNALDAITDSGDPRTTGFLDTYNGEVDDGNVGFFFDAWFETDGDVYAPLQITRFISRPTNAEMIEVRNQTGGSLDLADFFLGDEETPDGTGEGMYAFPSATLTSGGTFVVAVNGTDFNTELGVLPDAEFSSADATVPDMIRFSNWAGGSVTLADAGDEILALGVGHIILDVVTWGGGIYAGIVDTSSPATGSIAVRAPDTADTDDGSVDFTVISGTCGSDAACASGCLMCVRFACMPTTGASCDDGSMCTTGTTCTSGGVCAGGTSVSCDDSNACTADSCDPTSGCANTNVASGTSCADSTVCNGAETCDGAGTCTSGTALDCDDSNACTADSCDPSTGCASTNVASGTSCDDGDSCTTGDTCDGSGTCVATGTDPSCIDAGMPDAGMPDAGMPDAGMPDAGMPDAGTGDAGTGDAGVIDDGGLPMVDAGTVDAGADAGADAGPSDASVSMDAMAPEPDAGTDPDVDAGCSCRAGAARQSGAPWGLVALLSGVAVLRRRRR